MTLPEAIRAAGYFRPFARPRHSIPCYYNGHVKDWHDSIRMAMLSLEDLEATDWLMYDDATKSLVVPYIGVLK
jgi:hypothetical protein